MRKEARDKQDPCVENVGGSMKVAVELYAKSILNILFNCTGIEML